jgi:hypothetical protein
MTGDIAMTNTFLIYVSNRTDPGDAMLVRDIAIEASQTNRSLDVSGILMAVGDFFLQVLEGQEDTVEELLGKIGRDERHSDIRVLYRGSLPDRIFGQWSMGCVQSNQEMVHSDSIFQKVQTQIEDLCNNLDQDKGEELRDLIVRIPRLLAEEKVTIQ